MPVSSLGTISHSNKLLPQNFGVEPWEVVGAGLADWYRLGWGRGGEVLSYDILHRLLSSSGDSKKILHLWLPAL